MSTFIVIVITIHNIVSISPFSCSTFEMAVCLQQVYHVLSFSCPSDLFYVPTPH